MKPKRNIQMEEHNSISDFAGIKSIYINTADVDIKLITTKSDSLKVEQSRPFNSLESLLYKLDITGDEEKLAVSIKPRNFLGYIPFISFAERLVLYMYMPEGVECVVAETGSGNITTSGGLEVQNVILSTINGKICAKIKRGEVHIKTFNGRINCDLECDVFRVKTTFSKIKLSVLKACEGRVENLCGDMEIHILNDVGCIVKTIAKSSPIRFFTGEEIEWGEKKRASFLGIKVSTVRNAKIGDGGCVLETNSIWGKTKIYDNMD